MKGDKNSTQGIGKAKGMEARFPGEAQEVLASQYDLFASLRRTLKGHRTIATVPGVATLGICGLYCEKAGSQWSY